MLASSSTDRESAPSLPRENTRTPVAGSALGTSSWILTRSHSFSFGEFIRLHSESDFTDVANISTDDLQDYADSETAFELLKGQDNEVSCTLAVKCDENSNIVGAVLVCDCALIELYGPANSGYLSTSRGSLIVEDNDMSLYGHLIDLRASPVSQVDFNAFSKSKSLTVSMTFLGFHVFLKNVPVKASAKSDLGDSLLAHFSSVMSPPPSGVSVEMLYHKLDHLRTDLTAMEVRLRAHIDNQMDNLRRDIFQRLDDLKPKISKSEESDSAGVPGEE